MGPDILTLRLISQPGRHTVHEVLSVVDWTAIFPKSTKPPTDLSFREPAVWTITMSLRSAQVDLSKTSEEVLRKTLERVDRPHHWDRDARVSLDLRRDMVVYRYRQTV